MFDVDLTTSIDSNPFCTHGPTILFINRENNKRFYACSACRDHKQCNFHQIYDKFTPKQLNKWHKIYKKSKKSYKNERLLSKKCKKLPLKRRIYCKTCDKLIVKKKIKSNCLKLKHDLLIGIKKSQLNKPVTHILNALVNNQANAQYIFDKDTSGYLLNIIEFYGFDSILCVGTPTIFENLDRFKGGNVKQRLLLDIDDRLIQFYSKKLYLKYNMFNHHFFYDNKSYFNFINNSTNVLVLIDPPFGGIVKLIANTISKIKQDFTGKNVSIVLVYPYFISNWIETYLPDLKMIDFKVSYENQKEFTSKKNKGSTARIFTTIPTLPTNVDLIPKALIDDYYYCKLCLKYTYRENKHCETCNKCTSKDGGHYKHCSTCLKCVKFSYKHCNLCNKCHLNESPCY